MNHHASLDICARLHVGQAPIAKQPIVPAKLSADEAWEIVLLTGLQRDFIRQASGHKEMENWFADICRR